MHIKHTDKMPFGKYKDVQMQNVPSGYRAWFLEQDWAAEKFPDIYEYFDTDGASAGPRGASPETISHIESDETERQIFNSLPLRFTQWFTAAYGATKKTQPHLYLPFLRVAAAAWSAHGKSDADEILKKYQTELATKNAPVEPVKTPPPSKPKGAIDYLNDPLDEDVPF